MRSYGQLWERIIDEENILAAWDAFHKNHRNAPGVPRFHRNIESNLQCIRARLANGTWEPGQYHQFRVLDPKPRLISCCPVRDRVVHHALCNVIAPLMDRRFIPQSYACRKGKGSHQACSTARLYSRKYSYFLKLDVRKYFDNIDHSILLGIISSMFRERQVRDLCEKIVCRFDSNFTFGPPPANDGLCFPVRPSVSQAGAGAVHSGRGLPIGNLTSQWFANLYLDEFDHFATEALHLGNRYLRYMDDILVFFDSREDAWDAYAAMRDWLWQHRRLALKDEATLVAPVSEGFPFLGLKIKPASWRLKPSRLRRTQRTMCRHWKEYMRGEIGEERFQNILRSMEGTARFFGFKGLYKRFDRAPEAGSSTVDRVIRGGNYNNDASNCSSAYRNVNNGAGNSNQNIGARLVSVFDAPLYERKYRACSKTPFRSPSGAVHQAPEHASTTPPGSRLGRTAPQPHGRTDPDGFSTFQLLIN